MRVVDRVEEQGEEGEKSITAILRGSKGNASSIAGLVRPLLLQRPLVSRRKTQEETSKKAVRLDDRGLDPPSDAKDNNTTV